MEELYMYVTISDFIKEWSKEAILTQNGLDGVTDDSLKQQVYSEGRTLGRIAWHITTSIPEYLAHFGLKIDEVENAENVPMSAKVIAETFNNVSSNAAKVIEQQWKNETLKEVQI